MKSVLSTIVIVLFILSACDTGIEPPGKDTADGKDLIEACSELEGSARGLCQAWYNNGCDEDDGKKSCDRIVDNYEGQYGEQPPWVVPEGFVLIQPTNGLNAFYIGKYEVTQGEYAALMNGANPSYFKGDLQRPVENVNWFDAIAYANAKSDAENPPLPHCYVIDDNDGSSNEFTWSASVIGGGDPTACDGYRLPTGDEWEYAARAGSTGDYSIGVTATGGTTEVTTGNLGDYAWYCRDGYPNCDVNSERTTHPVGTKEPNAFGLYDMFGNVHEWTLSLRFIWPSQYLRYIKGGDFRSTAEGIRITLWNNYSRHQAGRKIDGGFRLVRTAH